MIFVTSSDLGIGTSKIQYYVDVEVGLTLQSPYIFMLSMS